MNFLGKLLIHPAVLCNSLPKVSQRADYFVIECSASWVAELMKTWCLCLFPEPPSLEDAGKMLNETVVVNNPIHLECRVSGNPLPGMHIHLGEHEADKRFSLLCVFLK